MNKLCALGLVGLSFACCVRVVIACGLRCVRQSGASKSSACTARDISNGLCGAACVERGGIWVL